MVSSETWREKRAREPPLAGDHTSSCALRMQCRKSYRGEAPNGLKRAQNEQDRASASPARMNSPRQIIPPGNGCFAS